MPEPGLRLQLLVFNGAMIIALVLTLGLGLLFFIFAQYQMLWNYTLPFLGLLAIVYLFARQKYFLLARILYVLLALAGVSLGIYLYGPPSHLSLYCLDLALLPFLLFRTKEWRWITVCTTLAFMLFVAIEFDLFPHKEISRYDPIHQAVSILFSMGAFFGVIAPTLLVFWQTQAGFRRALRMHRVQARDEKFTAIGRLAAGAAHEINNPLAIVQLTLENLASSSELMHEKSMQIRIRSSYEAIHRIHRSLQKLLSTTQMPMPPAESWLVSEIANLIGQHCRHYLKSQGIRLSLRTHVPSGYRVLCHRQSLFDVVDSLIHYALEAMAGQVYPRLRLALVCEDKHFLIRVEDSGAGVPEDLRRSIFTPFFTSKDIGGGAGLSLYSARCIAQTYGGDLIFHRGTGGCFLLSLPLVPESSARLAQH